MEKDFSQLELEKVMLDSLSRLMGAYGSMRQFVTVLISSHPDPIRLRQAWESRRPGWVDDEMAQPFFSIPEYQEAYTSGLASLTEEVDRAADAV